jgi:electron transfer flavoprotein beta subunit
MDIVVCFKQAINESEMGVDKQSGRLLLEGAPTKMSEFDKNAIEEAVKMKELHGGTVTAITVSPVGAKKVIKEALAMGCDRAVHLADQSFVHSDTLVTASLLAAAIRKIGSVDLILFAEGSSDIYSCQVGPSVAQLLDLPQITYANKLTFDGNKLVAERNMEEGLEVVETHLPCVVTVTNEINVPRFPTLMQIMATSKKEILEWNATALGFKPEQVGNQGSPIQILKIDALTVRRKNILVDGGNDSEKAMNLAKALQKEGVIQ